MKEKPLSAQSVPPNYFNLISHLRWCDHWSDCDGSGDKWPRREDNGECCPNQYLAGAPCLSLFIDSCLGSRGASPESEPRDAALSVMSAPCPMLLGIIPRPPPPLTNQGNVSHVPSIPDTTHSSFLQSPSSSLRPPYLRDTWGHVAWAPPGFRWLGTGNWR